MKNLKYTIKVIGAKILRMIGYLFWLFPIRRNRVLFTSYNGESYSCNPRYISEYLNDRHPDRYETVWAFKRPQEHQNVPASLIIATGSAAYLYYLATSRVIITNVAPNVFVPKRRGQTVIETWHAGGAYKKVALSQMSSSTSWYIRKSTSYIDHFISSSRIFTQTNIIEGYDYHGSILNIGMPRNDILINGTDYQKAREATRKQLGIEDCLAVLYAPTYRGTTKNASRVDIGIDFKRIIEAGSAFSNKKTIVLVRMHHHDKNKYSFNDEIMDLSQYDDMQKLLCAADLLITDYSSCIWDYGLSHKPCLLYVPDIEVYESARGLYTAIEDWPGVQCRSAEQLYDSVRHLDRFDFEGISRRHQELFQSYENGNAREKISELLESLLEG